MQRKDACRFFMPALIFVLISACDNGSLSRQTAKELIDRSEARTYARKHVRLYSGAFEKAIKSGMADRGGFTHPGIRELYSRLNFGFINNKKYLVLKNEMPVEMEIEGISAVPDHAGVVEVLYSWKYVDPPSPLKRFISHGGNGSAVFKQFDSGWKFQDFNCQHSDTPFPLSERELEAEKKEYEMYQNKLAKMAEDRKAKKQKALERANFINELTRRSKISSRTVFKYHFPGKFPEVEEIITLRDSDIIQVIEPDGMNIEKTFPFVDIFAVKKTLSTHYKIPQISLFRNENDSFGRKMRFNSLQARDRFFGLVKQTVSEWKTRYKDLKGPEILE